MENTSNSNSGRDSFDTENSVSERSSDRNKESHDRDASSASDVIQNMDHRYDTNPNRNNFESDESPLGLDDSPLDSAEWEKNSDESYANNEGREHRKEVLDKEDHDSDDSDPTTRDERNISFDRDL